MEAQKQLRSRANASAGGKPGNCVQSRQTRVKVQSTAAVLPSIRSEAELSVKPALSLDSDMM